MDAGDSGCFLGAVAPSHLPLQQCPTGLMAYIRAPSPNPLSAVGTKTKCPCVLCRAGLTTLITTGPCMLQPQPFILPFHTLHPGTPKRKLPHLKSFIPSPSSAWNLQLPHHHSLSNTLWSFGMLPPPGSLLVYSHMAVSFLL